LLKILKQKDMISTPINRDIVSRHFKNSGLKSISEATIREVVKLINNIEAESGEKFIRMEMGVPGLDVPKIGIDAEIEALKSGIASKYAMIDGLPKLKKEISRFVKLFLDIDVNEIGCVPTVGSTQGSLILFMVSDRRYVNRKGTLFIDPGFPVQKSQCKILGQEYMTFDVYDYRGEKLREKLESFLKTGEVSTILYSNPNNPSWICFTQKELQIIGELATKYDVIVVEDLAYFGMDFRKDYSQPGKAPFQPTVAKYTDNYVLLISSSKSLSYAGQRVGMMVISDKLYNREFPDLKRYYPRANFGYSVVYNTLYALTAGVSHTAQYGLAAMLEAVNDGKYNFRDDVIVYGERAKKMKKIFIDNGFKIVYDMDEDVPVADGFYFTVSYSGMDGGELLDNLLYYGISAIALKMTGSTRTEGLRACVSQISENQIPVLEERLKRFNADFGTKK
jgi:aspartate/methionine/tyrosine aminotransferase